MILPLVVRNISINRYHGGQMPLLMLWSHYEGYNEIQGFCPFLSWLFQALVWCNRSASVEYKNRRIKVKIEKEQNTNTNEFHGILGGNKPATVKAFRFTDLGHSPTFSGAAAKERTKQNHFTSFHFEYLINCFCYSILGSYINYVIWIIHKLCNRGWVGPNDNSITWGRYGQMIGVQT